GVHNDRLCADDGAVLLAQTAGYRVARAAAGSRPRATALRLSTAARVAATGGLHREPQAAVSALSRGTPHGAPARGTQASLGHAGADAGAAITERSDAIRPPSSRCLQVIDRAGRRHL